MTTPPVRFETLIDRHHDEIYSYLWRMMRSAGRTDGEQEAEDLTQEVFLRAYRAYARLRPDSNHRAWLYKIATNCAYTALRREKRHLHHDGALDDRAERLADSSDPTPASRVELNDALIQVQEAVATLPTKQRAAVILRHGQGLSYAAIARALDCSEESARANVYQGLRRLRSHLKENEKDR